MVRNFLISFFGVLFLFSKEEKILTSESSNQNGLELSGTLNSLEF